jgi:hypothetical protein
MFANIPFGAKAQAFYGSYGTTEQAAGKGHFFGNQHEKHTSVAPLISLALCRG